MFYLLLYFQFEVNLYRPIPLFFNTLALNCHQHQQQNFVTIAGSDINQDAQVYLLYEIPITLLAKRFNDNKCEKLSIAVKRFFF